MEILHLTAPAKINLFLRITGKRPDGYHELVSLICPVALYDSLTLSPDTDPGIRVVCDHPDVPADDSNLTARAARLFFETAFSDNAWPVRGLTIHLDKQIPVGAGLGGGSSDAAAVLTALNTQCGSPLSVNALMALGVRIGADVPFFIQGRPALATGIGERLEPVDNLAAQTVLLVYPGLKVPTAQVYKKLNLRLTKEEKKLRKFHFDDRCFNVDRHLSNDLEPVTAKDFPVIEEIKRLLLTHGAAGAMMSGSGSTVFGLFDSVNCAQSALTALRTNQQSDNWTLYVVDLLI